MFSFNNFAIGIMLVLGGISIGFNHVVGNGLNVFGSFFCCLVGIIMISRQEKHG